MPIAEHGLIGDLHSFALVGTQGTIDWYCCPRFDSPSVFTAILDAERGGRYRLRPAVPGWTTKQLYFPDSSVLITRFLSPEGVGEVEDFMPVAQTRHGSHRQRVIRRVVAVRARMHFELECAPRFDYGRERHILERHAHGAVFRAPSCTLALETEIPIETQDDIPRASPESVARAIDDAVDKGEEDIFPDPTSQTMADSWRNGPAKALERQNAALAQAQPVPP